MFRKMRDGSPFSSTDRATICAPRAASEKSNASSGLLQRHSNPGRPEERGFEGPRYRSRIGHIVAEIPSFIDARHDQVGHAAQHARDGDVHAIGRGPIDGIDAIGNGFESERTAQRKRVSDGTRFGKRGDDRYLARASSSHRQAL